MTTSTPTRVLQLVASSHGGAATHLHNLALGLPKNRYHCTIAMPLDGGNVSAEDFTAADIEFVPLSIAQGFTWPEITRLRHLLRTRNIDLLHVHGARAALYGRLATAMMRSRPHLIFSIHGFATPFYRFPKRNIYLALEKALQRLTSHTIAVAEAEATLFRSFGLATLAKMSVIPYGIDVARFATPATNTPHLRKTLALPDDSPLILTVCRLNVPRDFASLLIAFEAVLVEFPTAHLLIVGDGPQRLEVEGRIKQMGLSQAVQITGFRDDIPALMTLADIYVLTSYGWEGYPISTMEAQASGLPVVVTDAGGSKEAILHEKTGLVVPKCRPDLLAAAFLRLLRDSGLRRQMGAAGQQRARQEFMRTQMIEKISYIYDSVLSHDV